MEFQLITIKPGTLSQKHHAFLVKALETLNTPSIDISVICEVIKNQPNETETWLSLINSEVLTTTPIMISLFEGTNNCGQLFDYFREHLKWENVSKETLVSLKKYVKNVTQGKQVQLFTISLTQAIEKTESKYNTVDRLLSTVLTQLLNGLSKVSDETVEQIPVDSLGKIYRSFTATLDEFGTEDISFSDARYLLQRKLAALEPEQ